MAVLKKWLVFKMALFKTACPLDCWDQCALLVRKEKGKIISIEPDPDQSVTGRMICSKGKNHLKRLNHPDRLLYPLLKKEGSFKRIGWPEALDLMAEKLGSAVQKYGPLSMLHFYDGGYGGLLKKIEGRFFSALGGCTLHRGSLCWGAGLVAQGYDFGAVKSHAHDDLVNARLIIIWGRNPAYTQVHLLPFIRRARVNGSRVILIDPVRTATADLADEHIRVKPGTDGALALAMARVIIEAEMFDQDFIEDYCTGFDQFTALCSEHAPQKAAVICGVPAETVQRLAADYAGTKPAAILIGFGLQRHSNGGNTVRAIDALAALTGNIGIAGGGASYANFRVDRHIDHSFLKGDDLAPQRRYYPKPQLADALVALEEPPVSFLYISRANPLVQLGDSAKLRRAFGKVPFIVTAEHFMTDTAAASDLVLPASNFLEGEDIFYNSMSHQYIAYGAKIVEPPGECRPEYDYLKELADLIGAEGYPVPEPGALLARLIKPLTDKNGITLDRLKKESPLLLPGGNDLPWADRVFETGDRKYNFYSIKAEKDGYDALPRFREPAELSENKIRDKGFKYWFVTPHPRESIHSTHRLPDLSKVPEAYIHPQTAREENLVGGEKIALLSVRGRIEAVVKITDRVPPGAVLVYVGWWHASGAAVNDLTADRITDMGNQAAYYDCLCRIERA